MSWSQLAHRQILIPMYTLQSGSVECVNIQLPVSVLFCFDWLENKILYSEGCVGNLYLYQSSLPLNGDISNLTGYSTAWQTSCATVYRIPRQFFSY
jgi:hypothetical protein